MSSNQKNLDAVILSGNSPFKYDGVGDYSHLLLQQLVLHDKSIELYCGKGIENLTVDHYFPIIPDWGISSLLNLTSILRQKNQNGYSFNMNPTHFLLWEPLFC